MTLLETINLLNWIAKNQPNVNGIVETGDVFDLNKDEYNQKYAAFCATQGTHNVGEEFTVSVYRNGEEIEINIVLGEQPEEETTTEEQTQTTPVQPNQSIFDLFR